MRIRIIAAAIAIGAAPLQAQTPDSSQFSCDGRLVTAIEVESRPPGVVGDDPSTLRRAAKRFVFQSSTTRESTVRPFLRARVGDRCSDRWLTEVARVLRAQPYLASVSVLAASDGADGVRLTVETIDEVPLILGGGFSKGSFTNVKYGNANIAGAGLSASGKWREGRFYRDGLALSVRKYGLFDRPLVASLDVNRDQVGGQFSAGITHPFLSDLQHIAWYAGGAQNKTYRGFVRIDGPDLSLPLTRDVWAVGGVARYGWRGASVLVGPLATYEQSRPDASGVIVASSGLLPADTSILTGRYGAYRAFRAGGAIGLRVLNFLPVRGFDALLGEQDVARGIQLGVTAQRALSGTAGMGGSTLLTFDVYSGAGTANSFAALRLEGDGLAGVSGESWSAATLSGRGAWYHKTSASSVFEASLEFSGGWRERLPLQLSLGEAPSGVRGYNGTAIAGGRRAVLRLEQRRTLFSTGPLAQWGGALFSDIGKTWSGDVPFGQTTVARASVGVSLLAAVPPKSRRMLRADIAVPVTGGAAKRLLLRFSSVDATREFWRDPSDLAATRAGMPASPIFGWP